MKGKCWMIDRWKDSPVSVEVLKETEKTYLLRVPSYWQEGEFVENRYNKKNTHVFETWDEAKDWMLSEADKKLEYAKEEVGRRQYAVKKIMELKHPTGGAFSSRSM